MLILLQESNPSCIWARHTYITLLSLLFRYNTELHRINMEIMFISMREHVDEHVPYWLMLLPIGDVVPMM